MHFTDDEIASAVRDIDPETKASCQGGRLYVVKAGRTRILFNPRTKEQIVKFIKGLDIPTCVVGC
jgi:hypothetical protein